MAETFDTYNRRARLYPATIIALPISAFVAMIFASRPAWWTALVAIAGASGATYLVAQLIRSTGRAGEQAMWGRWGGAPTTIGLRYAGQTNLTLVDRRHRVMAAICPDERLPSQSEETSNPSNADNTYETVVSVVRTRTRDHKKFQLLFQENCNYGFRRNLLACMSYAYVALAVSTVASLTFLFISLTGIDVVPPAGAGIVLAIDIIGSLVVKFRINETWVWDAADSYAECLFEAAELLANP